MGECPVRMVGWFGRQKTISVGRELLLLWKVRKKIPEQVVKRASALTLQYVAVSFALREKEKKTVYMGKKATTFLLQSSLAL